MKFIKQISFLIVFSMLLGNTTFYSQSFIPKKGGIAFRTDDNFSLADFQTMKEKFNPYPNYHFSVALNFGASYEEDDNSIVNFSDPEYLDMVRTLQTAGHEIMDHTPNHRTNYFLTEFPAIDYLNPTDTLLGVDHIIDLGNGKTKVCLEFNDVNVTGITKDGTCDVNDNKLTPVLGDFGVFNNRYDLSSTNADTIYIFLESIDQLFFVSEILPDSSEITIQDVWEDDVNLGNIEDVNFYIFTRANRLSVNGLRVLASESIKILDSLNYNYGYTIERPYSWIQPGGRHPVISMAELSEALTPLEYTAGASFGDTPQSFKVFNEYDPDPENVKRFGMQWEDFNEDLISWNLTKIKEKIADGIAKHKVMIGHNHFYADTVNSPYYVPVEEYFTRVEEILSWCDSNSIDVNTYSEWADILYNPANDTYANVFPTLNVNLDDSTNALNPNGWPDSYNPRTNSSHGVWQQDANAPSNDNYCFSTTSGGWGWTLFKINDLGGVEKGENEFEIWTKGNHNSNRVEVIFSFPNTNVSNISYEFPAASLVWTKYNLSQSLNSNKLLVIPDSISVITVEAKIKKIFGSDSVKVSGMKLFKKAIISADLKVNLEGAFVAGTMATSTSFQNAVPTLQPFNMFPWNYAIGTESFELLPQNAVDWVLVELRDGTAANTMVKRKAGLVKDDGIIINADDGLPISFEIAEGDYYVVIYHRNHLPVMSSSKVPFYLSN